MDIFGLIPVIGVGMMGFGVLFWNGDRNNARAYGTEVSPLGLYIALGGLGIVFLFAFLSGVH